MSEDNKGNNGEGGNADDDKNKNLDNPADDKNQNKSGNGENKGDVNIPKHRFDEVNNELQTLKREKEEREKREKEAADKKLVEDKKFEELSAKRTQELEKANSTIRTIKVQSAVERVAAKQGAVDTEAVYKLIDQSKIEVDKDGNIKPESVEEAVKALLEAKPFLKGTGGSPANIGGGANPEQPSGEKKPMSWVREKWADPKWVREKHEELDGKTGEQYLNELDAKGLIDYAA